MQFLLEGLLCFCMFVLCHCYVFALQQLILYFLMVFVANSLQIACVSSFFLWFLLQIACKNEEIQAICKLLQAASYLQQKPSKSIELVAAKQEHSKNIASIFSTF